MDQQTLDYYEREAKPYAQAMASGSARSLSERFLAAFLPLLPPGGRVLELGCGGGRDSLRIIAAGFALDPTDGAAAMAAEAEALIGQPVRVLRFGELNAAEDYDAVWAHAALHHLPLADLPDALARVYRALKPGGWFFANYKLGSKDHGGDARDDLGRLYSFAPRDSLLAIYAAAGWDIAAIEDYRAGGLDKVQRDWIALTARKPG